MAEAICILLDTGRTASQKPPNSLSFLEASLECASLFVERKLFGESKDEIGVILFGSDQTNNPLDYDGVSVLERGLAQADWETISYIREHVKGTQNDGDWIDAVVVALDFLKTASENKKFSALKIVLFSELGCAADADQIELIIQGMKMLDNVDFTHIGPDWVDHGMKDEPGGGGGGGANDDRGEPSKRNPGPSNYSSKPRTQVQKANEELVGQLVQETDGMMCSLELAIQTFLYKNKKGKKPFPWKVCFNIGQDIKLNTCGYVMTRRETPKSWKRCLARGGEGEELKPETSYARNNENQDPVDADDLVMSYRFGTELVTISAADEAAAKFEGGPKSMSLFGFIARVDIKPSDLVGEGSMAFMPIEDDANSQTAWAVLIQAMVEMDVVAIVRKVYNKASTPRLGVLTPETGEDGEVFLSYVELPYAEDMRDLQFPSLPAPSDEQLSVMDELIDVMMLTEDIKEESENETVDVLKTEEMLNPNYQYLFQTLRHRAIQPGRVLPPPAEHITSLLKLPSEIEEAAEPVFERMNEIFKTKIIEAKKQKRTAESVFGKDEPSGSQEKKSKLDGDISLEISAPVTEVGSTTPVEDFRHLLSNSVTSNVTLDSVAQQLETVVIRLLSSAFGSDMNTKIVNCLSAYREECCSRRRPKLYNQFIKRVKECLGTKAKLWLDVAEADLGLIPDSEVAGGAQELEAAEFLLPPKENAEPALDDDDDDMLDML
eukprot:TRINITY_DN38449_c0_g1_i1.p1 TRINITY_DN38449_c0_g1~~TRINITY_DN38449_c0_g1_i1.p1  ORF type:complete len:720 (-),score=286.57 TRINITY_DN38449_c0_g1_i1:59-2218(-)